MKDWLTELLVATVIGAGMGAILVLSAIYLSR